MSSGLRLTPTRFFLPVAVKGGHVDLLLDEGCSIREVRERIILEAKRSSLAVDGFILAGDPEGKRLYRGEEKIFLDEEIPFDVPTGKLLAYVWLTRAVGRPRGDRGGGVGEVQEEVAVGMGEERAEEGEAEDVFNYYEIKLSKKERRKEIPLPEESGPSLPHRDSEDEDDDGRKGKKDHHRKQSRESLYHVLRKSRGFTVRKSKDEEFQTLETHLRSLLTYLEGLKKRITAFQDVFTTLCTETKAITELLGERLSDTDQEHSFTRMLLQTENVHSEEWGPSQVERLQSQLQTGLLEQLEELVEEMAMKVGRVGRRHHLWREFDYYEKKVKNLRKTVTGSGSSSSGGKKALKAQEKLTRNEGKLELAKSAFEDYDTKVRRELQELWEERHAIIGPLLAEWIQLEQKIFVGFGRGIRRVPIEPNVAVADVSDTEDDDEEDEDSNADGSEYSNVHHDGRQRRKKVMNPFDLPMDDDPRQEAKNPSGKGVMMKKQKKKKQSKNPFDDDSADDSEEGIEDEEETENNYPANRNPFNPFDDDSAEELMDSSGDEVEITVRSLPSSSSAPSPPPKSVLRENSPALNPFGDEDEDEHRDDAVHPGSFPRHHPSKRGGGAKHNLTEYSEEDLRVLYHSDADSDTDGAAAERRREEEAEDEENEPGRGRLQSRITSPLGLPQDQRTERNGEQDSHPQRRRPLPKRPNPRRQLPGKGRPLPSAFPASPPAASSSPARPSSSSQHSPKSPEKPRKPSISPPAVPLPSKPQRGDAPKIPRRKPSKPPSVVVPSPSSSSSSSSSHGKPSKNPFD